MTGDWIIEQSAGLKAQRGRFGRYSLDFDFKPPKPGWPPGTCKVTVRHAGTAVAEGTMVVQKPADEPSQP
ncbi:MAG TPA: hypothetical protein VGX78_02635, partial [Pirellulales bacterium]|nr:hypothetical protein [Pirellulales bacterium]